MNTQTHSCCHNSIEPANAGGRIRHRVCLVLLSVLVVSTCTVDVHLPERAATPVAKQKLPSEVTANSRDVHVPQPESAVDQATTVNQDLCEAPAKPDVRSAGRIVHSIRSAACDGAVSVVRRRVSRSFGPHSTPISASPTLLMLGVLLRL